MSSEEPVRLVPVEGKAQQGATPPKRGKVRTARSRRFRYWRRHTPHYYLVLAGVSSTVGVTIVDGFAYVSRSRMLAEAAFWATSFTALLICTAFFWGFYLLMNWRVPYGRIKYFVPHGIVGTLSPLVFALNVTLQLQFLGQPLPGWALVLSLITLGLLGVQFTMGKVVVHVSPLRLVKPEK